MSAEIALTSGRTATIAAEGRAITLTRSLTKFFEAGFRTVSAANHKRRLETCAGCEHHTGVRCKLCGCFTTMKAWMPHENCPINKWPV